MVASSGELTAIIVPYCLRLYAHRTQIMSTDRCLAYPLRSVSNASVWSSIRRKALERIRKKARGVAGARLGARHVSTPHQERSPYPAWPVRNRNLRAATREGRARCLRDKRHPAPGRRELSCPVGMWTGRHTLQSYGVNGCGSTQLQTRDHRRAACSRSAGGQISTTTRPGEHASIRCMNSKVPFTIQRFFNGTRWSE